MSNEDFVINKGDRIAQMVVAKHEVVEWLEVGKLEDTERGEGGFGHTKINWLFKSFIFDDLFSSKMKLFSVNGV